jgi:putative transposase
MKSEIETKEKDCSPYWNDHCVELNSYLWSPVSTNLSDSKVSLNSALSNEMLCDSWFSIELNQAPNGNLYRISQQSLQSLRAEIMKEESAENTLTKTRKIRIYPTKQQRIIFSRWFGTARYTYNKTVELLKQPGSVAAWRSIKGDLLNSLPEWSKEIPYQIKSIAIRDCCKSVTAAKIKCKETGIPQTVHFKKRRDPLKSCYIPKSAVTDRGLYYTLTKELKWSEELPESFCDARLIKYNGRYYVSAPYKATVLNSENQGRIVALDPGVRNFISFYSDQFCGKIGAGDFKRIFRLCRVLDKLQSILSKPLSFYKRARIKATCGRIRWKIWDLVSELHHKTALFFVKNFDVILLPTFEVSQMVRRELRKIKSKTARQMLTLGHFRFKQFLKHKAFEFGKIVVDVSEAFTSKTVSWTGEIIEDLGGRRTIQSKIDGQIMDRDYNGARGIFFRALVDSPISDLVFEIN